jgi:hypothetical protein
MGHVSGAGKRADQSTTARKWTTRTDEFDRVVGDVVGCSETSGAGGTGGSRVCFDEMTSEAEWVSRAWRRPEPEQNRSCNNCLPSFVESPATRAIPSKRQSRSDGSSER